MLGSWAVLPLEQDELQAIRQSSRIERLKGNRVVGGAWTGVDVAVADEEPTAIWEPGVRCTCRYQRW